jgi:hypothetical protein
MSKQTEPRLFEFRIKYKFNSSELNSYRYYMAVTPDQALSFHKSSILKANLPIENLSLEKYDPYAERWVDCSDSLFR